MSWSYCGNLAGNTLDYVRFLIGDTDTTDQQISDEEISGLLTLVADDAIAAAIAAADHLSSKYAGAVDKSIGDLSIRFGQKSEGYRKLATQLRQKASLQGAAPYAGGLRISDKAIDPEDTDAVQPTFRRGMMDYPGTEGVS